MDNKFGGREVIIIKGGVVKKTIVFSPNVPYFEREAVRQAEEFFKCKVKNIYNKDLSDEELEDALDDGYFYEGNTGDEVVIIIPEIIKIETEL